METPDKISPLNPSFDETFKPQEDIFHDLESLSHYWETIIERLLHDLRDKYFDYFMQTQDGENLESIVISQPKLFIKLLRNIENDKFSQMQENKILRRKVEEEIPSKRSLFQKNNNFANQESVELKRRIIELQKRLKEAENRNSSCDKHINSMEKEIQNYRFKIHNLEELLLSKESDISAKSQQLKNSRDKLLYLRQDHSNLESKYSQLLAEVGETNRDKVSTAILGQDITYVDLSQNFKQLKEQDFKSLINSIFLLKKKLSLDGNNIDRKLETSLLRGLASQELLLEYFNSSEILSLSASSENFLLLVSKYLNSTESNA